MLCFTPSLRRSPSHESKRTWSFSEGVLRRTAFVSPAPPNMKTMVPWVQTKEPWFSPENERTNKVKPGSGDRSWVASRTGRPARNRPVSSPDRATEHDAMGCQPNRAAEKHKNSILYNSIGSLARYTFFLVYLALYQD